MQPDYPYELEPHEQTNWARVWGRWRNNANILMLLGCDQRTAENIAATWPPTSDDLLDALDARPMPCRYDDHGVIMF